MAQTEVCLLPVYQNKCMHNEQPLGKADCSRTSSDSSPVGSSNSNPGLESARQKLYTEPILQDIIEFCMIAKLVDLLTSASCKKPEYAHVNDRYKSFSCWKYGDVQNAKTLAEAGFYYSGVDDRVQCFMCGGALCSWQRTDIPWYEHARWYGNCPYVQQCRQHEVVSAIIDTAKQITESRQSSSHQHHHHCQNGNIQRNTTGKSTALPSVTVPHHSKSSQKLPKSTLVQNVLDMGFTQDQVKQALLSLGSQKEVSKQTLVERVLSLAVSKPTGKYSKPKFDSTSLSYTASRENICQSSKTQNEMLRSSVTCKVCMEKRVGVIFLPCGHLTCCLDCGLQLDKCPLCRKYIKATAAVHM